VSYATGVDGFRHVFNYQPSGNIDKIRRGSTWTYYDYTTTGRPHLVSTRSGGMSGSFGYDSAGNTTVRTMGGVSQSLTYDESNWLTQAARLRATSDHRRQHVATLRTGAHSVSSGWRIRPFGHGLECLGARSADKLVAI
jgi:hypothetical protein